MMDMGTDQEAKRIEEARNYIGAALFDSVLHPVITAAENPKAVNMKFFTEE